MRPLVTPINLYRFMCQLLIHLLLRSSHSLCCTTINPRGVCLSVIVGLLWMMKNSLKPLKGCGCKLNKSRLLYSIGFFFFFVYYFSSRGKGGPSQRISATPHSGCPPSILLTVWLEDEETVRVFYAIPIPSLLSSKGGERARCNYNN